MPIPQIDSTKHNGHNDPSSSRRLRAEKRHGHTTAAHESHQTGEKPKKQRKKGNFSQQEGLKAKLAFLWAKKWFRIICYIIVGIIVSGILAIIGAFAWVSRDLADIADLDSRDIAQSTRIYANDGQTVLYDLGDNRRQDVKLEDINQYVIDATLALEDRRFYQHGGFDPIGITRAALSDLTGIGVGGGASTLSQQFIKNAVLTNEVTFTRKAKEVILAVRLEQRYSKDEIMNMYLNEVYYGPNYQGVEVAAQEYFKKSAKDVSLSEAAILASLPKNPVVYPHNPERLKTRRDYALDVMAEDGKITKEEAEEAKKVEVNELPTNITEIKAPHFVFHVIEQLEEQFGQVNLRKNGYKVITTLDWDKQQKAEKAIADGYGKIQQYGGSNAALVSIDTKTGQVIAMVGSHDYFDKDGDGEFNVATSPTRQPGSSIKPLVYMSAFEKGFTPDTKVWDVETDFPSDTGVYHPRNYNLGASGLVSLRSALPLSLNIPAVKVLYLAGLDHVIDNAEKLGYTTVGDRKRYGLAFTLGGVEVSLLEHTAAYGAFAREGELHKTASILKIEDQNGKTIEEWKDESTQAVEKDAARMLNSILSDQGLRYSPLSSYSVPGHAVSIKTGTTNDFRDAWTMGYTPSIATGVWTGNNDNSSMNNRADGSVIAAPIWFAYMRSVLEGTQNEEFNKASWTNTNDYIAGNIESESEKSFDSVTGKMIPDECVSSYPSQYVVKKKLKEAHSILFYVNKDDLKAGQPKEPKQDPMFESWEKGVADYLKDKGSEYITGEMEKVDCDYRTEDQQPKVSITSLTKGQTYTPSTFSIVADITPGKGRTINELEYRIDGKAVEKALPSYSSVATRTATYNPGTKLKKGKYTVSVWVSDDRDNTAEYSVEINYNPETTTPSTNTNTNTSVE